MAVFTSDAFADVANTLLTAHTGSLGETWTATTGNTGAPKINPSGTLAGDATGTNASFYTSKVPFSADYSVTVDVVYGGAAFDFAGPIGRCATGAETYYRVTVGKPNAGALSLDAVVAGTRTILAQPSDSSQTSGVAYRVRLTMTGTTISMRVQRLSDGFYLNTLGTYQAGTVECASVTDSSIAAAGRAGIYFAQLAASGSALRNFTATDGSTVTPAPKGFKKYLQAAGFFAGMVISGSYPVPGADIGGWTNPAPVTAVGSTTAALMAQTQAGSRLYYVSTAGTNPTTTNLWTDTGLQGNGGGEVYLWNGTNIIDSNNQTSPGGVGVLYGTDPTQPGSSVKAFKHWSWVAPRRAGGVPGSFSTEIGSPRFNTGAGRVDKPDLWFFRAGDTFDLRSDIGQFAGADGSLSVPGGSSAGNVQWVGRYGPLTTAHPKFIRPSKSYGFLYRTTASDQPFNNAAYDGLDLAGYDRTGYATGDSLGVTIFGALTTADRNILFEDVKLLGGTNLNFQFNSGTIKMRRCQVRDAFVSVGHVQGIYIDNYEPFILQMDDCLLGRNGFATDPSSTAPAFDAFNRNCYFDGALDRTNSYIKNSTILYGASAEQFRCGIPIEGCYIIGGFTTSVQGATYLYANDGPQTPLKITGFAGTGSVATVTTDAVANGFNLSTNVGAYGVAVGNKYTISDTATAGYNGEVTLTAVTAGGFSYASTATGASAGGFIGQIGDSQGAVTPQALKNCVVQTYINSATLSNSDTSTDGGTHGGGGVSFTMGFVNSSATGNIITGAGLLAGQNPEAGFFALDSGSQGWYSLFHNKLTGFNLNNNIGWGGTAMFPLQTADGVTAGVAGNPSYASFSAKSPVVVTNTLASNKFVGRAGASTAWHDYIQRPGGSATDISAMTETTNTRYSTQAAALTGEVTWTAPTRSWATYMATLMAVSGKDGTTEAYALWDTMRRGQWRSDMHAKAPVNYVRAGFGLAALP